MRNLILSVALSSLLPAAYAVEATWNDRPLQVASAWDDLKTKAAGGSAEIQDWSSNKLNETLAEFSTYLPVFREAGFEVSEVAVTMTLIPTVAAEFTQFKVIPPAEQARILKQQENKKMLSYMLRSLFKVYGMQFRKYKVSYVEIALSVPPYTTVALEVKPDEAKPGEAKPGEATPGETTPEGAKRDGDKPAEGRAAEAK